MEQARALEESRSAERSRRNVVPMRGSRVFYKMEFDLARGGSRRQPVGDLVNGFLVGLYLSTCHYSGLD